MKKFYALGIATLLCGSALAEGRQPMASNAGEFMNPGKAFSMKADLKEMPVKMAKKAATRAEEEEPTINSVEDLAGTWTLTCLDLISGLEDDRDLYIEVADAEAGEIAITGWRPDLGNWVLPATVDIEAGTVVLPLSYYMGRDVYGCTNYFYIKSLVFDADDNLRLNDGVAEAEELCVGMIHGQTISWDAFSVWAIGDPEAEDEGWWLLTGMNELSVPLDPNIGWEDYCTATYEDAWIIPGFDENPADYPWTVNVQKSTETEGLYRLDCPYIAEDFVMADYGHAGYIVFDISNPDFVPVLTGVYCGWTEDGDKFYNFNLEGYGMAYGFSAEEIMSIYEGEGIDWSTYKDGVVTINNAGFDVAKECDAFYTWSGVEDMMVGKITFDIAPDAVGVIGAETLNKVEYFNMQGMRVANPSAGQLLIKRTANGAVKTVIR